MFYPLARLILILLTITFLVHGVRNIHSFINVYSLALFIGILVLSTISKHGLTQTFKSILYSIFPIPYLSTTKANLDSLYKFSYRSAALVSISGICIVLFDFEHLTNMGVSLANSIAITLLPVFYSTIYCELLLKTIKEQQ